MLLLLPVVPACLQVYWNSLVFHILSFLKHTGESKAWDRVRRLFGIRVFRVETNNDMITLPAMGCDILGTDPQSHTTTPIRCHFQVMFYVNCLQLDSCTFPLGAGNRHQPELLFSSDCFSFSLQLRRNFREGSEVALLLLTNKHSLLHITPPTPICTGIQHSLIALSGKSHRFWSYN